MRTPALASAFANYIVENWPAQRFAVHTRSRIDHLVELARLRGDKEAAWRLIRARQRFATLMMREETT